MKSLRPNVLALVLAVALSPCHADQPAMRSAMSAKAVNALAQHVVAAPVSATSIVNRAALNPQPLPPGPPDPDRARIRAKSAAEQSGIIIVGGSPHKAAAVGSKPDQKKK